MKKILFTFLVGLTLTKLSAQEINKQEKGYFNLTELEYFDGNNDFRFQTGPNSYSEVHGGAYAIGLRNINGVFITNKISIGVGLALTNYTRKEIKSYNNTFQLFADVRYYFKNEDNSFFVVGNAGGSIAIADNIDKGPLYNLGIGYKLMISQRQALTGSISYVDQSIDHPAPIYKDRYYGLGFKVGLLL